MDFKQLLHVAKKNSSSTERKDERNKFYSTKFAPPKKETKEQKRLSDNIKKFLEKKEIEEKQKAKEEREKRDKLLASRDNKSKNKIKKMLKVIKSANKSVLEDAKGTETAVTANGSDQPDNDDYGYVSNEAAALFQQYCEKVKDVQDDKGFAKSRPQSRDDIKGTKERVRQALIKEQEDKLHPGQRTRVTNASSTTSHKEKSDSSRRSGRDLYDPKAEKEAEEKKRREEEMNKKAKLKKKPPPPPMNFSELLKLAAKKQFEPVAAEVAEVKPKAKEPERLLTAKEKKELEEREAARTSIKSKPSTSVKPSTFKEKDSKTTPTATVKQKMKEYPPKISGASSNAQPSLQSQKKPITEVQKTRAFPPKDIQRNPPVPPKNTIKKTRDFPPKDTCQKTRAFPPTDVRYSKPSSSSFDNRRPNKRKYLLIGFLLSN